MHILCTRGVIVDFRRIALWWRLAIQYLFSKGLLSMGIGKGYTTRSLNNRKVKERKMIVVWRGNICSFRLLFLLLKTSFWLAPTPPPLHLRYLLLLSCSNVNLYGSSQDKCHADWLSSFPTIIKTLQGIKYFQISNLDNKNFGVRVASPASSSFSLRIVLFLSLSLSPFDSNQSATTIPFFHFSTAFYPIYPSHGHLLSFVSIFFLAGGAYFCCLLVETTIVFAQIWLDRSFPLESLFLLIRCAHHLIKGAWTPTSVRQTASQSGSHWGY